MRSATAATTAPGSSASDMIRSFSSDGHRRRRSTVEMISAAMCLTVLSHVLKDSMLHLIRRSSASRIGRSREPSLTDDEGYYAALIRMFQQALTALERLPASERTSLYERLDSLRSKAGGLGWGVKDEFDELWHSIVQ